MARRLAVIALVSVLALTACSTSTGEATTKFDGGGCSYVGPAEFELGTEAVFTFVNTSDGTSAGYGLWKVPDGTTVADIEENGIFGIGASQSSDQRVLSSPSSPGFDKEFVVALDTVGLWAVNCFTAAGASEKDYPATVFVVTDS